MAAPKKQISLLPKEGLEATTLGRVLSWALTAGRTIVIITELAVVLAFVSRFWFDRTLTDLNEEIDEKVNTIRTNQPFERQFRNLQARLVTIDQIVNQVDAGKLASTLISAVPPDVRLDQLTVSRESLQITGLALSESSIEAFIAQLEAAKLGQVSLTQFSVTTEQEIGIKFALAIKTKKDEK